MRIIDADGHVMEKDRELREFLPAAYRERSWFETFSFFPSLDGWARGMYPGLIRSTSAEGWLRFLDTAGIEQAVLYPTAALAIGLMKHRDWCCAMARAYNDWLHTNYLQVTPRLHGVGVLPVLDVTESVRELERLRDIGMVAAMLPGVMVPSHGYGEEGFAPLFAAAERLNMSLAIHGAPSQGLGLDHSYRFAETHTLEHPLAQMTQFTSIMLSGIPERYPALKLAFLEAGCGWMAYLVDRLDEEFERRRGDFQLQHRPSEVVADGNIYVACELEERLLPAAVELLGARHILYPSDYPHERAEGAFLGDIPGFQARTDLTEEVKARILGLNAAEFYGLGEVQP